MLKLDNVRFHYKQGRAFEYPDLACREGEKILVLGESGSGKTTLLHLIAAILKPSAGSITLNGVELSRMDNHLADQFRGQHIGMVFQRHLFFRGLTVFENLEAARKLSGLPPDKPYLEELAHIFGVSDIRHTLPARLSQGEQQRFSIARALANRPMLVLADEPTSSLDDKNCMVFADLINKPIQSYRPGWIIATHDQRLRTITERIYTL